METLTNKLKLIQARQNAIAEFPSIKKDATAKVRTKTGGEYSYKYSNLKTIMDAIQPKLTEHGLGIIHDCSDSDTDNDVISVTTILYHTSGEFIQITSREKQSLNLFYMQHVQGSGTVKTYLKRYNISDLLNLVTEEDTDGNNPAPEKLPNNPGNTQPPKTDNSPPKSDVIVDSSGTHRYYPKEWKFNEAYQNAKGLISTSDWQGICKLAAANIKLPISKKDKVNILAKWIKGQYGYSFFDLTKDNIDEVLDILSNNAEIITEKK